jgi:hypothetical protein
VYSGLPKEVTSFPRRPLYARDATHSNDSSLGKRKIGNRKKLAKFHRLRPLVDCM